MIKKSLTTLLMLLALSSMLLAQETAKSGAKVYIDETAFDFGYIYAGTVVSHSYVFHSRGTDSLKILNVKPGCGCTKAPIKKEIVAVGDSTDVELVFTSNKGSNGAISKSATVNCNDIDRATLQLTFKGKSFTNPDSLLPLILSDGELVFSSQSRAREAKLTVKNVSAHAVKIHLVSIPSGYLRVDLPETEIKPGAAKEIKVKIDSSMSEEQFKKSFTFAVDDEAGTRYSIPVSYTKDASGPVVHQASSNSAPSNK